MPQLATAFPILDFRCPTAPDIADALASVARAGRTIADLRARLADAEIAIATLDAQNLAIRDELRAARWGLGNTPAAPAEVPPNRSHLDQTLAALVAGLGPALVRAGP